MRQPLPGSPRRGRADDSSWVAIDFELANEHHASACSAGLVAVEGGVVVDRRYTTIRPPEGLDHFSPYATAKHGMTFADVANAPSLAAVLPGILEFIAGRPLVAHNASVERAVLDKGCAAVGITVPDLVLCCTLRIAKQTWQLPGYTLGRVAAAAGLKLKAHHHALNDAEAAAQIALAAMESHGHNSLGELVAALGIKWDRTGSHRSATLPREKPQPRAPHPAARFFRKTPRSVPEPDRTSDASHPLHGRTVCFTGQLTALSRDEAWRAVAACGGQVKANLTKATDFLVVGTQDPDVLRAGETKSSTHLRAERYGTPILDEAEFLALLRPATAPAEQPGSRPASATDHQR
ncbi:exonuclease domain-containing protein [Saccharopolyspora taberi]|uniref:BRCT domain-containing protein n=1 Tax=Saccharopolyspora taberi TaxID=60895 RepID=A0ABN3V2J3_9PSEU